MKAISSGTRIIFILILLVFTSCSLASYTSEDYPDVDRLTGLPSDIEKRSPSTDQFPPILHSHDYEEPIPIPGDVNTIGGEDSAFILPDGETLYFFFTPDVRIPHTEQITDGLTGIYVSYKENNAWGEAARVRLEPPGTLSLDGAASIDGGVLWFVSAREGYDDMNVFTARWVNGRWQDWQEIGSRLMDEIMIGEVEPLGDELYFHSNRPGGKGGLDIWITTRIGDTWSDPVNIEAVNTEGNEGWPDISPDGTELWFTRTYNGTPAIFRSTRQGETWGTPELIHSQLAGESSVDSSGNIYFTHHYFENGQMIEEFWHGR